MKSLDVLLRIMNISILSNRSRRNLIIISKTMSLKLLRLNNRKIKVICLHRKDMSRIYHSLRMVLSKESPQKLTPKNPCLEL